MSKDINYLITNRGKSKDYAKDNAEKQDGASASPAMSTPSPFNLGRTRGSVESPNGPTEHSQPNVCVYLSREY